MVDLSAVMQAIIITGAGFAYKGADSPRTNQAFFLFHKVSAGGAINRAEVQRLDCTCMIQAGDTRHPTRLRDYKRNTGTRTFPSWYSLRKLETK